MKNFTPIVRKSERKIDDQYKFNDVRNTIITQVERSLNQKFDILCKIDFVIDKSKAISNRSILSFSHSTGKPVRAGNVPDYEIYFTKEFLDSGTLALSEQLELFKSQLPIMFIVNQELKWRIMEIFESMGNADVKADLYKNELIRTLIHELVLFTHRLVLVDASQGDKGLNRSVRIRPI